MAKTDSTFQRRMQKHLDELKWLYMELYQNTDMFSELCDKMYEYYTGRSQSLKKRDGAREKNSAWYKKNDMLGMMLYIDNFAKDLKGVEKKLDYLEQCHVNYIHLMPFLDTIEGRSDGGYAVADFRRIKKELGAMEDLESLTDACHEKGLLLILDSTHLPMGTLCDVRFPAKITRDFKSKAILCMPADSKYKIYISALTTLNIDEHNRIPTTDGRLLRRLVRDARTRGATAKRTVQMWPSVRKGETENIFPFQESADAMFNSALIYELSVLKQYAEPLLLGIRQGEPEYTEAKRLLKFLNYFQGIDSNLVPNNSILREFIGGSYFNV